jgi:S1-C subfamily serine protease
MFNLGKRIVILLMIYCSVSTGTAQTNQASGKPGQPRMVRLEADKTVFVQELGVVIIGQDKKLVVLIVPQKDRPMEGLQKVDLQKDDEIKMMNGKNLKSIKELRAVYESAEIDHKCKIGVYREGKPHLITFVRKAEKDLPAGMQMRVRKESGNVNSNVFPALGIEIENKGSDVIVIATMPHAPNGIMKGDMIKSLNGITITNIGEFAKEFDATKIGDPLKFELVRAGKTTTATISRPKPLLRTIIK